MNQEEREYIRAYERVKYFIEISSQMKYAMRESELQELAEFFDKYDKKKHYVIYDTILAPKKGKKKPAHINIFYALYDEEDYKKLPNNERLVFGNLPRSGVKLHIAYISPVPNIQKDSPVCNWFVYSILKVH